MVLVQQAVIAKAITVAIKNVRTKEVNSGILLPRQGNVYTVLTAGHVVNKLGGSFKIKTADGQVHQAISGSVRLPGSKLDLAVLKFRSSNSYTLVKIGTSNNLEELSPVYLAGFPAESTDSNEEVVIDGETLTVTEGKVTGKAAKGNAKGYSLIYSNITRSGMSGGPVLNMSVPETLLKNQLMNKLLPVTLALLILIGYIATPSITKPDRPNCDSTLRSVNHSLKGVLYFKQRTLGNMSQPRGRSQYLGIIFNGFEELPTESTRKSIATHIIKNCSKIASVSFGLDQTDGGSIYGIKKGQIIKFACIEAGGSKKLAWGETYCP